MSRQVLPAVSLLPDDAVEGALLELLDRRDWGTPATQRRLGAIEASHHRYAEARLWLEKAAARAAPDVPLLMDLARFAFKAGDAKGALGYLAHARALEPANAAVHFLFGIVCVELNLGAEAHEALTRAVSLDPGSPEVNYAMGAVSLHRHDPSEALPFFETYVRLRPQDPRGRFALGAAKYYSQRLDDARADLAVAAADPVTAPGAHYYLARIARQQHDLATARREIDAALKINPSHADGWAELGLIETRQGDYVAARSGAAEGADARRGQLRGDAAPRRALRAHARSAAGGAGGAAAGARGAARRAGTGVPPGGRGGAVTRGRRCRAAGAAIAVAAILAAGAVGARPAQPAPTTQRPPVPAARTASRPTTPSATPPAVVQATQALAAGELERAASLVTAYLGTHPRSTAARVVIARIHLERGDLDAAYRELDRAATLSPRDVDVLYYLGLVSGQLAAEQFERLAQATPVSARGHQVLAESLEAQERRAEAEREYEAAMAAKPDLVDALLGLARLRRIRLDCDGATALYTRAEAVRPSFEAAYGLGTCLLREQNHAAALTQLRRAVERDPTSLVALVGLGSALLGLGRPAEAVGPLEQAVAIEPAMDDGWYVLGRAYQAAGHGEQARRAFATVERLRQERAR